MHNIFYSDDAVSDLHVIYNRIAADNIDRAESYMLEFSNRIKILETFPLTGKEGLYPELQAHGIRILNHDNYLIFYSVDSIKKQVDIIKIKHGSTRYIKFFK